MTPEQRERRIYHHLYETCEGISEQTERIVAFEELVADMMAFMGMSCLECDRWVQLSPAVGTCCDAECKYRSDFKSRIKELEVPL